MREHQKAEAALAPGLPAKVLRRERRVQKRAQARASRMDWVRQLELNPGPALELMMTRALGRPLPRLGRPLPRLGRTPRTGKASVSSVSYTAFVEVWGLPGLLRLPGLPFQPSVGKTHWPMVAPAAVPLATGTLRPAAVSAALQGSRKRACSMGARLPMLGAKLAPRWA